MDHSCDLIEAPDECFRCKMRYVRAHGGLSVAYQGSRPGKPKDFFHESTIPERQRQIVARAAEQGWEARQVHSTYDRPAKF